MSYYNKKLISRGKILSGGQKARGKVSYPLDTPHIVYLTLSVSLARAIYSRASTLILDDVISAVDAETAQHIIKHCFQGPIMQGRTVIIASHAVEALGPLAEKAIFLDQGQVVWKGTGPELLASKHMLHLMSDIKAETMAQSDNEKRIIDLADLIPPSKRESPNDFVIQEAPLKTPKQLILDEKRGKGHITYKLCLKLIQYNGSWIFHFGMLVILLAVATAPVASRHVLEWVLHCLLVSQDITDHQEMDKQES